MPPAAPPTDRSPWWRRWWSRGESAPDGQPSAGTPLPAPGAAAAQGPGFGPYRVVALLGQGASGPVYQASDGRREVALKVLVSAAHQNGASQADERQRFQRQAQVMHSLSHPDIVAVVDAGEQDGRLWIAMELAPGTDLARYTRRDRLLPEPLVLRIGARVALALAHAHAQGVVHRDLKPANVRLDLASGRLKLLDFGTARLEDTAITRTGVTLGTPAYMAPEQLLGEPADARTDLYALGVMLYELLSGSLPYPASTLGELLRAVSAGAPTPLRQRRPELPAGLEQLVAQMLQADPSRRPANLAELAQALELWASHLERTDHA
jgi:serine/threonine-protein kinase